jgi:hypothetical protein
MAFDPRTFPRNTSQTFGQPPGTYDPEEEANARERFSENLYRLGRLNTTLEHPKDPQLTSATKRHPLNEQYDLLFKSYEEAANKKKILENEKDLQIFSYFNEQDYSLLKYMKAQREAERKAKLERLKRN